MPILLLWALMHRSPATAGAKQKEPRWGHEAVTAKRSNSNGASKPKPRKFCRSRSNWNTGSWQRWGWMSTSHDGEGCPCGKLKPCNPIYLVSLHVATNDHPLVLWLCGFLIWESYGYNPMHSCSWLIIQLTVTQPFLRQWTTISREVTRMSKRMCNSWKKLIVGSW